MSTNTTDLEPLYSQGPNTYSPEVIEQALATLALAGGNTTRAREQLLAIGLDIPVRTLTSWKSDRFPNRYTRACEELAPRIEAAVVDLQRELAVQAAAASQQAVALEAQRLSNGEVKDASASARNLATTAGIAVDKVLSLTGRPTQITEHRNTEQVLRRLGNLVPGLVVEGTAEEEPPEPSANGLLPASA